MDRVKTFHHPKLAFIFGCFLWVGLQIWSSSICMSMIWCINIKVFQGGWIEMFSFNKWLKTNLWRVCQMFSFKIKKRIFSFPCLFIFVFFLASFFHVAHQDESDVKCREQPKSISHDSLKETIGAPLWGCASLVAAYGQGLGKSLFSNVSCLGCQFVSADKLWQPHQSSLYPDKFYRCLTPGFLTSTCTSTG